MEYETLISISNEEIQGLFKAGYLVLRTPILTKHVTNITRQVFNIGIDDKIIKSADQINKYLILLRHPQQNRQIEILTDDVNVISSSVSYFRYLTEPISTTINVQCIAIHPEKQIYLDKMIRSIDGYSGWQVKLLDKNDHFEILSRIQSIKKQDIENEIENIRLFMDSLCMVYRVGFFIRHISTGFRTRMQPAIYTTGTEEMLRPIKKEQVSQVGNYINSSPDIGIILRGLNQAYIDNCYPSRLDRLWAVIEEVFRDTPKHLLSNEETESIIKQASSLSSLDEEPEHTRLNKFIDTLKNPERLSKETRNERISKKISKLLDKDYQMTYEEIRKASRLRGMHGHNVSDNWLSISEAEKYLRQVIIEYLDLLTTKDKNPQ